MTFEWQWTVTAAGVVISALALAAAIVYLRRLQLPRSKTPGRATLILPLTGRAPGLEDLLEALAAQTLAPHRLLIAVEAMADPAYRRAMAVKHGSPFPIGVVVAGPATRCGQKCWNQIAAAERIDAEDDVIVLLDADILPQPWWLSALVSPIMDGAADIVTGYRWPVAARRTLGVHLVVAIDRAIGLLPRLRWARVTWGGTLALSQRAFRELDVSATLGRTLSDDMPIGEEAAARGLRVLTPRALLVKTPVSFDLIQAWRFGRRQYQIMHLHRPVLWAIALLILTTRLVAWGVVIAYLGTSLVAQVGAVLLIGLAASKLTVRRRIGARLGLYDPVDVRAAQLALAVFEPVVDLFHWSIVLAAARTRRICWGHLTYEARGPYDVTVVKRTPWHF
jgi:cellulose synthase/poly-beta-1,6-N-acetylglucosamine synthase-like glycosyltransferase